jgi:transposase-like protein
MVGREHGYRESAESWKALLRELKRRGLAAPVVAVGDGALGFWAATREVWPETREQACWCHKLANVLDKLPQRLQPRAKRALHEMMYAACRTDCAAARSRFEAEYQAKYPRAAESLTANWERLVTFFDFPAEHWKHLRTTHVIESPFATVRLRERDQGRRFKNQGTADGVQVARHGAASLAAPRWHSAIAAGSCRREVRGWSSPGSTEKLYSLKRRPTEGSRLIMAGRSTTFDNYSDPDRDQSYKPKMLESIRRA